MPAARLPVLRQSSSASDHALHCSRQVYRNGAYDRWDAARNNTRTIVVELLLLLFGFARNTLWADFTKVIKPQSRLRSAPINCMNYRLCSPHNTRLLSRRGRTSKLLRQQPRLQRSKFYLRSNLPLPSCMVYREDRYSLSRRHQLQRASGHSALPKSP